MAHLDAASLNKMLLARVRDSADERREPSANVGDRLRQALGLFPTPPRTDLVRQDFGQLELDGVRVQKLAFASRPEFPAPALLYTQAEPSDNWIVFAADAWPEGKGSAAAQGFGVGLCHQGFSVLCLEPPGKWYDLADSDRSSQGGAWLPELRASAPALGQYAWEMIRAVDLALASGAKKVALGGAGIGGEAALLAFALDDRPSALVCAGCAGSLEKTSRMPASLAQLAGITELGDVADWISVRQPAPILLMTCEGDTLHTPDAVGFTADKLRTKFMERGSGAPVKFSKFLGGPDFNRRMRETAASFLLSNLAGQPAAEYSPEPRPITDGNARPAAAGTWAPEDLRVWPMPDSDMQPSWNDPEASSATLSTLAERAAAEKYPEYSIGLLPWGKYGKLERPEPSVTLVLSDSGAMPLPIRELDYDLLCAVGLSGAEFLAQILHLWLPGHPEGFESVAKGDHLLSAMVSSVRTMVKGAEPKIEPKLIVCEGAVACEVGRQLLLLRPDLEVQQTEGPTEEAAVRLALLIPGGRYRRS